MYLTTISWTASCQTTRKQAVPFIPVREKPCISVWRLNLHSNYWLPHSLLVWVKLHWVQILNDAPNLIKVIPCHTNLAQHNKQTRQGISWLGIFNKETKYPWGLKESLSLPLGKGGHRNNWNSQTNNMKWSYFNQMSVNSLLSTVCRPWAN